MLSNMFLNRTYNPNSDKFCGQFMQLSARAWQKHTDAVGGRFKNRPYDSYVLNLVEIDKITILNLVEP